MRRLIFALLAAIAVVAAAPQVFAETPPNGAYIADPAHAYVTFSYDHLGFSRPTIGFKETTARLNWNGDDPSASSVAASINAASLESFVPGLNKHLKAP
ncbi:MAG: YceI family protein, partial [Pseudomonadota bacterium]